MTQYLLKATVLILLGAIAVLMVFIAKYWAPDRTIAELKQWQLPNSEFIDIQGMQAHVAQSANCYIHRGDADEKNQPETIVLLHGTSASLHTWEGWTKALSDQYCVVSMDLPGFGLTGPYVDESTRYSSENYAAFVIQVLNYLKVDRVTLAGNSLGYKAAVRHATLPPNELPASVTWSSFK